MFATNKLPPSFLRILFMICTFIGMVVIVLGGTQDRNVVEKVGTALVMPSGLLWILLLTLSIQLCMQKNIIIPGNRVPLQPQSALSCFQLRAMDSLPIIWLQHWKQTTGVSIR